MALGSDATRCTDEFVAAMRARLNQLQPPAGANVDRPDVRANLAALATAVYRVLTADGRAETTSSSDHDAAFWGWVTSLTAEVAALRTWQQQLTAAATAWVPPTHRPGVQDGPAGPAAAGRGSGGTRQADGAGHMTGVRPLRGLALPFRITGGRVATAEDTHKAEQDLRHLLTTRVGNACCAGTTAAACTSTCTRRTTRRSGRCCGTTSNWPSATTCRSCGSRARSGSCTARVSCGS